MEKRKNELKKISILVPVYNVQAYMEFCAHSLFSQDYSEVEYIFVDDCSPDKSIMILQQVLDKYPSKKNNVRILHHEKNLGLAAARNTALEICTGDYFMCVDSDDALSPGALLRLGTLLTEQNPDLLIFDFATTVDKASNTSEQFTTLDAAIYKSALLKHECQVSSGGKVWKTSIWKNNAVAWIPGINYGEDNATVPRAAFFCNKIINIPDKLYFYRINPTSLRHSTDMNEITQRILADRVLIEFFSSRGEEWNLPLNTGLLRTKLFLLEAAILKSKYFPKEKFNRILRLYPQLSPKDYPLPWILKLLLWASSFRFDRCFFHIIRLFAFFQPLYKCLITIAIWRKK